MKTEEFEDLVLTLAEDTFDALVGSTHLFYGIDCNAFKLSSFVYEAIEDEDDGYRSYLGSIDITSTSKYNFQQHPLAVIRINYIDSGNYFNGYQFIDVNTGHCWLEIGTDHSDDYYPYFVFNYNVDITQTTVIFR